VNGIAWLVWGGGGGGKSGVARDPLLVSLES